MSAAVMIPGKRSYHRGVPVRREVKAAEVFSVDVRPDGHADVFALRGELDHHSSVQLREAADALLVGPRPAMLLVIDCTALEFCDSSGIGGLISIYQRLSAHGGALRLAAVPDSVARVFRLTGLDQVISVYGTAQDALADGGGQGLAATADGGGQGLSAGDVPFSAHAASERWQV